jgi:hypothetical protein
MQNNDKDMAVERITDGVMHELGNLWPNIHIPGSMHMPNIHLPHPHVPDAVKHAASVLLDKMKEYIPKSHTNSHTDGHPAPPMGKDMPSAILALWKTIETKYPKDTDLASQIYDISHANFYDFD